MELESMLRIWSTLAVGTALLIGACSRNEAGNVDTTAADTAPSVGAARADSGAMPGAERPPAQDANHEFLRQMSDHHQGLILMASEAMTKASRPETQADAHQLHLKQEAELKDMVAMVRNQYGESFTPTAMPKHKAMNDSLQTKSGLEYDRTFYRDVIEHHREAIVMVDQFMPRLTKPEVRQMAERMKSDQQKEIEAFQQKLNALRG